MDRPGRYYYNSNGGIERKFNVDTLANYGIKHMLPCGETWILGSGFTFCLYFSASGYDFMPNVIEFNSGCKKWKELELHLLKFKYTIHTKKEKSVLEKELGVV